MRIGLVGCGKKKLDRAAPTRELYTGPLFRAALRYAEATCDRVFVLSAKHGLVELDAVVEPYDLRISDLSPEDRRAWSLGVASRLTGASVYESNPVEVVVLAGRDYCAAITRPDHMTLTEPLFGLQIGERLRWLAQHTPGAGDECGGPIVSAEPEGDEPAGDAAQLAAEILDWEAQFGPTSDDDTCEVSGEDMARWVRMARATAGVQA